MVTLFEKMAIKGICIIYVQPKLNTSNVIEISQAHCILFMLNIHINKIGDKKNQKRKRLKCSNFLQNIFAAIQCKFLCQQPYWILS